MIDKLRGDLENVKPVKPAKAGAAIPTALPRGARNEGHPGHKMGESYTPNAGEDFTSQPQLPRERAELDHLPVSDRDHAVVTPKSK